MANKHVNIWIWLQNGKLVKAVLNSEEGTLKIYDQNDNQF